MFNFIGEVLFCPLLIVTAFIRYCCFTEVIEVVVEVVVVPTATGIKRKFNGGIELFLGAFFNSFAMSFATLNV